MISTLKRFRFGLALGSIAIIASLLGFLGGSGRASSDRRTAQDSIAVSEGVLANLRAERIAKPKRELELKSLGDRSLGGSSELVDSALRARMNRVLEELSLSDASVGTSATVIQGTPARSEFAKGSLKKLREEPDFGEIQATVAASGRYDQMLELLYRLASEPWLHRIDMFRFDQKSSGDRVGLTVRITTLFIVGSQPSAELMRDGDPVVGFAPYAALATSNPFLIPSPPPIVIAKNGTAPTVTPTPATNALTADVPAAAPTNFGFPYGTWKLTGVVRGPTGDEVFLRCVDGSALQLAPGQAVGDLVLKSVEYDIAEFESSGVRVRIRIGDYLSQRSPIGQ